MIVVGADAVVHLVADAGRLGEAVRKRAEPQRLATPYLLDVEVASALHGRPSGGKLTDAELDAAWDSC